MNLPGFTFADPVWLVLLVVPLFFLIRNIIRLKRGTRPKEAITVGSAVPWQAAWGAAVRQRPAVGLGVGVSRVVPILFRAGALALVVIALARPQTGPRGKNRSVDGLDIQLVIDTSGSMRAQDFELEGRRPNRLEVVKAVIDDFVMTRLDDRIGLVVFGTEAFTQAPLTLDHQLLQDFLKHIEISMAGDATAIGDGLATAVKRLKDTESKGKIVILLTDGANNAGRIDPVTAAEAAKALGIRVYTIGVGRRGKVPITINGRTTQVEVDIDEALLEKIAQMTDGHFYRATDTQAVSDVYRAIDKLEKTAARAPVRDVRRELFASFLWPALILLGLDILFGATRRRIVPS